MATERRRTLDSPADVRRVLREAGLLADPPESRRPMPSAAALTEARREAARGKSLTDYVIEDRD